VSNEIGTIKREIKEFNNYLKKIEETLEGTNSELISALREEIKQLQFNTDFLNSLTPNTDIGPFLVAFTSADNLNIYLDRLDFILNTSSIAQAGQSQPKNFITIILKTFCNRIGNCLWQIIQKMWTPKSWSVSGSASIKVPFLSGGIQLQITFE
jgi:hypothetical protein